MAVFLPGGALLPPQQQTLRGEVVFSGIGLHTGRFSRVTVCPAPADHGRVFVKSGVRIPAEADYVGDTTRCSTLTHQGEVIHTVEHLLAALYALGVDNAEIRIEGTEAPALDGSARPFADGLLEVGIEPQGVPPHNLFFSELVWVRDGDRHVIAIPGEGLTVGACVDFGRPYAGPQNFCYSLEGPHRSLEAMQLGGRAWGPCAGLLPQLRQPAAEGGTPLSVFLDELAPARTFCFEDWIAAIRAAGLGSGGSLDNTLVLGERGPSTPLRFPDELARHKTLDLLGDMALVGARLQASVIGIKAGHALHVAAAHQIRKLVHDPQHPGDRPSPAASLSRSAR